MHAFLFTLALGFGAVQDDKPDTFGKTEAQILAMGQDKWDDFYGKKAGNSTADMVQMSVIYGEAMLHRNDRLLKTVPAAKRARILKLRKTLMDFGRDAVELGYNIGGGGTMWSPIDADVETQAETVIYGALGGSVAKVKATKRGELKHNMALLAKTIETTHKDQTATYFHYSDAKQTFAKMNAMVPFFQAAAKRFGGVNGTRILRYGVDYAGMARDDWS